MLEFYVESDSKLRHLRQCPLGEHMEGFAGWLRAAGYQRRPAQPALPGQRTLVIGPRRLFTRLIAAVPGIAEWKLSALTRSRKR